MNNKEVSIQVIHEVVGTLALTHKLNGDIESKVLLDKVLSICTDGEVELMPVDLIDEINKYGENIGVTIKCKNGLDEFFYAGLREFPDIRNLFDLEIKEFGIE